MIFLEKGHTQNANDSMHSTIERAKRNIFHPYQWEAVMQFACKSKPYNVKVMNQDEIYNFTTQLGSVYSNLITIKLTDIKGNPHKVKCSSLCHVCLQRPSGNKLKMLYKYDLTTPFQVAVIGNLKKPYTRRSSSYETNLDIPKAYSETLVVTPLLKKDLFHSFYESLLTGTVMGDDPDNIDPDCDSGDSDSDAESE